MGFEIGQGCRIHPSALIQVESGYLGAGSIVNEGARIEGTKVEIGREAFIDRYATIGGGSCFDPQAFLKAGDWFHMGYGSQINLARGVQVGHEFGCGIETKIFTHGAYIDSYNLGAPVQWEGVIIGDSVWMPNAWVNPGVKIGSNVIIAARSLVNKDIPNGALAAGVPCKIIKSDYLPRTQTPEEKSELVLQIFSQAQLRFKKDKDEQPSARLEFISERNQALIHEKSSTTIFDLKTKAIEGPVSDFNLIFKDQLRRNGIRFRFHQVKNIWQPWSPEKQLSF